MKKVFNLFAIAAIMVASTLICQDSFAQVEEVLGEDVYPGRSVKLLWDNDAKKVTNVDDVNQFVKRNYREGWKNLTF